MASEGVLLSAEVCGSLQVTSTVVHNTTGHGLALSSGGNSSNLTVAGCLVSGAQSSSLLGSNAQMAACFYIASPTRASIR